MDTVTDRTALKLLDASTVEIAFLKERGREGVFTSSLLSSLPAPEQTKASNDTQEADYVLSSPYVWHRKLGVPRSAQKYGMLPENTAAQNVTALNAAIANEPYVIIPAETDPYLIDQTIVSSREGQIIEGEGHNTVVKASAVINAPMFKTTTNRRQQIRSMTLNGDSKAKYGLQLDYPKCDGRGLKINNCTFAGAWISYFTCFIGDGSYIDNNFIGVYAADGTGQVNNSYIGGGMRGSISSNQAHGILVDTSGRSDFNISNWNMENNGTAGGYAHVAFNSWVRRVAIHDMYHETDINSASNLMYRFTSSVEGVSLNNIYMNASPPTTKPNHFIHISNSSGTIAECYSLSDIWAGGYNTSMIKNGSSLGGYNQILVKSIFLPTHANLYDVGHNIRFL